MHLFCKPKATIQFWALSHGIQAKHLEGILHIDTEVTRRYFETVLMPHFFEEFYKKNYKDI